MLTPNRLKTYIRNYKDDRSGGLSIAWAVSALTVFISVGAAYDLSQISSAKSKAQHMADSMALMASVAVDRDNNDRLVEGRAYSFKEITGQENNQTKSLRGQVYYDVVDDKDPNNTGKPEGEKSRLIARSTVHGTYKPAFMSVMKSYKTVAYSSSSDVAYSLASGQPASVFFAVDNSGSMGWNDSQGNNKLASLETSMQGFMTKLNAVNVPQNNIFRTALYPYSADYPSSSKPNGNHNDIDDDGVIPARVVGSDWGTLTSAEITSMRTRSGTDSSGALEDAENAFPSEDAAHFGSNGEGSPLKFLVFMSDGANNGSYKCETETVWVPGRSEYWTLKKKGRTTTYYSYPNHLSSKDKKKLRHYPAQDGYNDDRETCTYGYYADDESIASCDAMKADGVSIYTIGYHLKAGSNGVSQAEVNRAKNLLQSCASAPEQYILASDAAALEATFDKIGEEIIEEVIRIKR